MPDRKTSLAWVERLVSSIPCRDTRQLDRFIQSRPFAKIVAPKPEIRVGDHWFCTRRYKDVVSEDELLEVYVGSGESSSEHMGYDRLDPHWQEKSEDKKHRWELSRAYMRPRFRGRNYSVFMLELVLALARKNRAYSVVAYPRHVAMLVTLLKNGFRTTEGNLDMTLSRILHQGKTWYARNASQRQLYYAEEFRPFIQDGSFIMEKRVSRPTLWEFLMEKV